MNETQQTDANVIAYQLAMINQILTVWYEIEIPNRFSPNPQTPNHTP